MHLVRAKGLLSQNNGMNIYRGCTHGCIYCDSRSRCYNFTHDFEDVEVKENAPELLEEALRRKRRRCMISTGAMSDPYMHCEKELGLMRRCLEIIDRYEFGAALQTKSCLVERDLDLLGSINRKARAVVQMTLTTADDGLCRILEPCAPATSERAATLRRIHDLGIDTVVWLTPILPFINDTQENIDRLLDICGEAGVSAVIIWNVGVTLREGDREYFYAALDRHFPGMKERYIKQYGDAYDCPSPDSPRLMEHLRRRCSQMGILCGNNSIFRWMAQLPETNSGEQLSLF